MPTAPTYEYAKDLYALAINIQRTKNYPYALRLFEGVVETGETFYMAFALVGISQCYANLGLRNLETATLKRVTQLTKQQQLLLNPGWLAFCYQRSGDLKEATTIHREVLKLMPRDQESLAALAEIDLLIGNLDEAETFAREVQQYSVPRYQILGRMIRAFALAVRGRHDEAAIELSWVAEFLISSGSIPVGTWDYSDLQPLIAKTGTNSETFQLLTDALQGKIALAEFTSAWVKIMPSPRQLKVQP